MKITSIEPQKKKDRFNIFLDGEFAFGLYKDTIYDYGLRINDELPESKIKEILSYDEINYGKKTALRFINYKARTEKEVITKLKEKKLSEDSISKIISYLKEYHFIDDKKYAEMFIESKVNHSPEAQRIIKLKLLRKGIKQNTVNDAAEKNYSPEKEFKKALELKLKYEKKVRYKNEIDKKQKTFRFLLSKGFSYDMINEVFNSKE